VRPLVCAAAFVCALAACPKTDPPDPDPDPPDPPGPLVVDVTLAPNAPAPADDPPPTAGLLPSGVPDTLRVFDLGLVAIEDGVSPDILVDVTSGVGSVTVLVYGHEGSRVVLERVIDPDGIAVVSDVMQADLPGPHQAFARGFPAQVFSQNRVLGSVGHGGFLVPNTPELVMKAGQYVMNVGQFDVDLESAIPDRYPLDRPVRVIVMVAPTPQARGALKVAVHLTGSEGLNAQDGADDPFLREALDTMTIAYELAGVDIEEIVLVDIDPTLQTIALEEDQCEGGELPSLFAAGAASDPSAVPVFLIERFACVFGGVEVGDDIGGIAGGIPGLPYVRGGLHAGVAISTDFALRDGSVLGVVMAHELGHYLGLYHTRESSFFGDQPIVDNIADTPTALPGAADNLMYFAADESIVLTPGQGRVMRASAWVRAEAD
jgi:hypothetical protein